MNIESVIDDAWLERDCLQQLYSETQRLGASAATPVITSRPRQLAKSCTRRLCVAIGRSFAMPPAFSAGNSKNVPAQFSKSRSVQTSRTTRSAPNGPFAAQSRRPFGSRQRLPSSSV